MPKNNPLKACSSKDTPILIHRVWQVALFQDSPTVRNFRIVTLQQILDAIKALHDLYDVERSLEKTCAQFDFEFFSIISLEPLSRTRLKLPASNPAMTHVLASNFPDAIKQACERDVSQASGPVFAALHQSSAPLMVRLSADGGGNAAPLRDMKRDIDPANWLSQTNVLIPLLGTQNDRCVVGFHGKAPLPNAPNLAELAMLASGLFGRFCELGKVERVVIPVLSQREVECLRWTSAGKTSHEMALILQISEHTVNHYITLACRKLNTVNRIQAVALAIRLKIIK